MKRGGRLRPQSKKTAARERKASAVRRQWKKEAGACMVCDHGPTKVNPALPRFMSSLEAHEISNGSHRQKTIGEACCVLVACVYCNRYRLTDKKLWPEARQLALLQGKAPERYDLRKYLELTSPRAPNRITQSEVDAFKRTI